MQRRWFLSYNSQDLGLAQRVEAALAREDPEGRIFFAPRSLRAGGYWLPELHKEIAEATAFVLLVGEKGLGTWQTTEYYEALDKHVKTPSFPLILVLLENQPAPGLAFLRQLHWIVTADPSSAQSVARLMDATAGAATRPGELWRYTAPYRGLAAMTESDSDFFFGRGRETIEVLRALEAAPDKLPILLGNSGVGKSSLAQAGVLAAFMRQAWPETAGSVGAWPQAFCESRGWCVLKVKPGGEPVRALVEPFLRTWQFDAADPARAKLQSAWVANLLDGAVILRDLLDATELRYRDELHQPTPPAFLLYIDQGEELYVRAEEKQRRRFSQLLAQGLGDPRLRALMSLRADFLGALLNDEALYKVHLKVDVPPLREEGLLDIVSRPAALLGARFESDGFAADISRRTAEESAKDAGALPLLSYLLDDMWTQMVQRGDGVLRLPAKAVELGGVLADRANAFLLARPGAEDQLRRVLTLKLATVRPDGEPTRRRALRSEFSDEEWRLVSELADHPHRLLVTATPEGGETYADVAHEAVFRRWQKLREWVTGEREFLVWMNQLEADRRRWAAAPAGSKHDALLMGLALADAQRWLAERGQDLPKADREFVEQSLERERLERAQRRRHQWRRRMAAAAAAVLVVLGLGGGLFWWDRFEREKSAYYAATIWRWGLPEGLGPVDEDARGHREASYHILTKGGKVRQVSLENSAGALRDDENGVARWDVVYRESGAPDRVRLFKQEGLLVREEVFAARSSESASVIFVDSEGAKSQEAMRPGFFAFEEGKGEVKNRSEVTRNRLIFDNSGNVIEKRYENQFAAALPNIRGSFGQRFSYSADGLVTSQTEIGRDGNAITLKNGVHRTVFEYSERRALVRQSLFGQNSELVAGDDGYASLSKDYDRWGSVTAVAYFAGDGKPALSKKLGVPVLTIARDEHGNPTQSTYVGFDAEPMLNKDGYARISYSYDALGKENGRAYLGVDGKAILSKDGYAAYRQKFDERGNIVRDRILRRQRQSDAA